MVFATVSTKCIANSQNKNPVDYIVHCGDYCKDAEEIRMRLGVPVASVRGNCDGGFEDTDFSILETEAGNFLITHGHMQNVDLMQRPLLQGSRK